MVHVLDFDGTHRVYLCSEFLFHEATNNTTGSFHFGPRVHSTLFSLKMEHCVYGGYDETSA